MPHDHDWKPGPLPPGTWNWGGVVLSGTPATGFYFADFHGDYVLLCPGARKVEANEIAFYNNCLELPSGVKSRVGA